jgi:outer membrane scaffolding protein for murein synthesis (MipA/OmpV family)
MKRQMLIMSLLFASFTANAAEGDILSSPRASQRSANAQPEAEIGGIVGIGPGYLGAQKTSFGAGSYFEANFGNGVFLGQDGIGYRTQNFGAFSIAASLGASMSRPEQAGNTEDHNRLSGMGDVTPRAQANLFGNYDAGSYHVAAWLQRELGNRDGVEFQLTGLYDVVASSTDLVQLYAGLDYANQAKMQTFFGVTAKQASSSGNPMYTPEAGVAGSGVGTVWRHAFSQHWVGSLEVGAISLRGSAADSPLTARKTSGFAVVSTGYRF